MSQEENEKKRLRGFTLVLWVLYSSFAFYLFITLFLIFSNPNEVQLTLFFEDITGNVFGSALVLFYLVVGLYLTLYLYRRTLRTLPHEAVIYALAAVVVGVAAPYIYALLISFMGIMRDIFPVLFVVFFYVAGIIVGLRIIPELTDYLTSE